MERRERREARTHRCHSRLARAIRGPLAEDVRKGQPAGRLAALQSVYVDPQALMGAFPALFRETSLE